MFERHKLKNGIETDRRADGAVWLDPSKGFDDSPGWYYQDGRRAPDSDNYSRHTLKNGQETILRGDGAIWLDKTKGFDEEPGWFQKDGTRAPMAYTPPRTAVRVEDGGAFKPAPQRADEGSDWGDGPQAKPDAPDTPVMSAMSQDEWDASKAGAVRREMSLPERIGRGLTGGIKEGATGFWNGAVANSLNTLGVGAGALGMDGVKSGLQGAAKAMTWEDVNPNAAAADGLSSLRAQRQAEQDAAFTTEGQVSGFLGRIGAEAPIYAATGGWGIVLPAINNGVKSASEAGQSDGKSLLVGGLHGVLMGSAGKIGKAIPAPFKSAIGTWAQKTAGTVATFETLNTLGNIIDRVTWDPNRELTHGWKETLASGVAWSQVHGVPDAMREAGYRKLAAEAPGGPSEFARIYQKFADESAQYASEAKNHVTRSFYEDQAKWASQAAAIARSMPGTTSGNGPKQTDGGPTPPKGAPPYGSDPAMEQAAAAMDPDPTARKREPVPASSVKPVDPSTFEGRPMTGEDVFHEAQASRAETRGFMKSAAPYRYADAPMDPAPFLNPEGPAGPMASSVALTDPGALYEAESADAVRGEAQTHADEIRSIARSAGRFRYADGHPDPGWVTRLASEADRAEVRGLASAIARRGSAPSAEGFLLPEQAHEFEPLSLSELRADRMREAARGAGAAVLTPLAGGQTAEPSLLPTPPGATQQAREIAAAVSNPRLSRTYKPGGAPATAPETKPEPAPQAEAAPVPRPAATPARVDNARVRDLEKQVFETRRALNELGLGKRGRPSKERLALQEKLDAVKDELKRAVMGEAQPPDEVDRGYGEAMALASQQAQDLAHYRKVRKDFAKDPGYATMARGYIGTIDTAMQRAEPDHPEIVRVEQAIAPRMTPEEKKAAAIQAGQPEWNDAAARKLAGRLVAFEQGGVKAGGIKYQEILEKYKNVREAYRQAPEKLDVRALLKAVFKGDKGEYGARTSAGRLDSLRGIIDLVAEEVRQQDAEANAKMKHQGGLEEMLAAAEAAGEKTPATEPPPPVAEQPKAESVPSDEANPDNTVKYHGGQERVWSLEDFKAKRAKRTSDTEMDERLVRAGDKVFVVSKDRGAYYGLELDPATGKTEQAPLHSSFPGRPLGDSISAAASKLEELASAKEVTKPEPAPAKPAVKLVKKVQPDTSPVEAQKPSVPDAVTASMARKARVEGMNRLRDEIGAKIRAAVPEGGLREDAHRAMKALAKELFGTMDQSDLERAVSKLRYNRDPLIHKPAGLLEHFIKQEHEQSMARQVEEASAAADARAGERGSVSVDFLLSPVKFAIELIRAGAKTFSDFIKAAKAKLGDKFEQYKAKAGGTGGLRRVFEEAKAQALETQVEKADTSSSGVRDARPTADQAGASGAGREAGAARREGEGGLPRSGEPSTDRGEASGRVQEAGRDSAGRVTREEWDRLLTERYDQDHEPLPGKDDTTVQVGDRAIRVQRDGSDLYITAKDGSAMDATVYGSQVFVNNVDSHTKGNGRAMYTAMADYLQENFPEVKYRTGVTVDDAGIRKLLATYPSTAMFEGEGTSFSATRLSDIASKSPEPMAQDHTAVTDQGAGQVLSALEGAAKAAPKDVAASLQALVERGDATVADVEAVAKALPGKDGLVARQAMGFFRRWASEFMGEMRKQGITDPTRANAFDPIQSGATILKSAAKAVGAALDPEASEAELAKNAIDYQEKLKKNLETRAFTPKDLEEQALAYYYSMTYGAKDADGFPRPPAEILATEAPKPAKDLNWIGDLHTAMGSPSFVLERGGYGEVFPEGKGPMTDYYLTMVQRFATANQMADHLRELVRGVKNNSITIQDRMAPIMREFARADLELKAAERNKNEAAIEFAKEKIDKIVAKRADAIVDLAKRHREVRIFMAADQGIDQLGRRLDPNRKGVDPAWTKIEPTLSKEEWAIAQRVSAAMNKARFELEKRDIPVTDMPYMHRANYRLLNSATPGTKAWLEELDIRRRMTGPQYFERQDGSGGVVVDIHKIKFHSREKGGFAWFPSLYASFESYVPMYARNIANRQFIKKWNGWQKAYADEFPRVNHALSKFIEGEVHPKMKGVAEQFMDAALRLFYVKHIAFSVSVAAKHAMKLALDPVYVGGLGANAKGVGHMAQAAYGRFIEAAGKGDLTPGKTAVMGDVLKAHLGARLLAQASDTGLDDPVAALGSKGKHVFQWLAHNPVNIVEAYDRGVTLFSTIAAEAAKNNGDAPDIVRRAAFNALAVNFMGFDRGTVFRGVGRAMLPFMQAPTKLTEIPIELTTGAAREIAAAIKGEGSGKPLAERLRKSWKLTKYILIFGLLFGTGKGLDADLKGWLFHPPTYITTAVKMIGASLGMNPSPIKDTLTETALPVVDEVMGDLNKLGPKAAAIKTVTPDQVQRLMETDEYRQRRRVFGDTPTERSVRRNLGLPKVSEQERIDKMQTRKENLKRNRSSRKLMRRLGIEE